MTTRRTPRSRRPIRSLVHHLVLESGPGDFDSTTGVADDQSRPPDVIPQRRGAMTREVAPRQLAERLVACEGLRARRPLLEKRVGELLALPCAAADDAVQFRVHHHDCEPVSLHLDPGAPEHGSKLRAGQLLAAPERALDSRAASFQDLLVQSVLGVVGKMASIEAGAGQREHPADVGRRHEMPRRAQHVRPQDAPLGERRLDGFVRQTGSAQPQRPLGAGIVLRLDRAKPGDDVGRILKIRTRELLPVEAPVKEAARRYRFASSNASTSFDER